LIESPARAQAYIEIEISVACTICNIENCFISLHWNRNSIPCTICKIEFFHQPKFTSHVQFVKWKYVS
jgi:hypothetical protein